MAKAPWMQAIQAVFSGMTKGGMTEVMAQGYGLGKVLIQAEADGDGAGNLSHLKDMGETGTVVISGGGKKNLGFMFQAPKGFRVKNAVPVPLEGGA
jgi:hypothetical protein